MGKADGEVPLHLVIQCRTGLKWGLQNQLTKCAVSSGLTVLDQRSWHPRGFDVIVVSEIYVSDIKTMISFPSKPIDIGEREEEAKIVSIRCEEIKTLMLSTIAQISAEVKVVEWMPFTLQNKEATEYIEDLSDKLIEEARMKLDLDEEIDTLLPEEPLKESISKNKKALSGIESMRIDEESPMLSINEDESKRGEKDGITSATLRRRRRGLRYKTLSVPAFGGRNLWDDDLETQKIAMESAYVPTVTYDLSSPSYGQCERKCQVSDLSQLLDPSILPTVEEHLEGYVRHNIEDEK